MTEAPKPKLVAEIGCNHKGDMGIAREMLGVLKHFCKVSHVKFQKRTINEVLSAEEYKSPHLNPRNSYGATYGEHREALEFTIEQHGQLFRWCDELGLVYSSSVWDMTSAREIAGLGPKSIKIPSPCSTNWQIHRYLCESFPGEIHVSTGMTTKAEIESLVGFYLQSDRAKDLVLYHCTSGYPVPFSDVNIMEISSLKYIYGNAVKAIGFSGHHLGISVDIAAYALGAEWIERHYTLDRTWKGTDHAASVEPDGLRRLQRDLEATYSAMSFQEQDILDIERPQVEKLRWDRKAMTGTSVC